MMPEMYVHVFIVIHVFTIIIIFHFITNNSVSKADSTSIKMSYQGYGFHLSMFKSGMLSSIFYANSKHGHYFRCFNFRRLSSQNRTSMSQRKKEINDEKRSLQSIFCFKTNSFAIRWKIELFVWINGSNFRPETKRQYSAYFLLPQVVNETKLNIKTILSPPALNFECLQFDCTPSSLFIAPYSYR